MNFAKAILDCGALPEKVALLTQQGDVTYGELHQQAQQVCADLRSRGLKSGDRVLLASDSSPFWVASYLGVALAGGVSVPMAVPANPVFFADVVQATEPRFAFVQPKWVRRLGSLINGIEHVITKVDTAADNGTFEEKMANDLAAIMFTSGSTATPRGVMVSHGNILSNSADIIASLDVGPDDRIMAVLPFHYCFGTSLLHTH